MGEYADEALEEHWRARGVFGGRSPRDFYQQDWGILFGKSKVPRQFAEPQFYPNDYDGNPNVYCSKCGIHAVSMSGNQVYRRADLSEKMFWVCRICGDRVGCHPHTNQPLGYLADAPTRAARSHAHARFDAVWRTGLMSRTDAYRWLAGCMGLDMSVCHIGMMDLDQLNAVIAHVHARFPQFTPQLDNIANFRF